MSALETQAAGFTALRPLLFSIAYRMLGQATDAEDMVQEAWLRYSRAPGEVRDPRAWLIRVVTRLCLDELGSARARRERYVGPWLPEPVLTGGAVAEDPLALVERRDLLSLAALTMLERLSGPERAVLVLREGLGLSHAEIGRAVGISEVSSRQLLSRARRRVTDAPARKGGVGGPALPGHRPEGGTPPSGQAASPEADRRLVEALLAAFEGGAAGDLLRLLREDVVAITDGGGEVVAARRPILGSDRVTRFIRGVTAKLPAGLTTIVADVNGRPALVLRLDGAPVHVVDLVFDAEGRAAQLLVVSAPAKLAYVRGQARAAAS